VIPEIVNAILAGHDMLFMGEKGQAKSRLMRMLAGFLDEAIPYLDIPGCPVHEDPYEPDHEPGQAVLVAKHGDDAPIAWWPATSATPSGSPRAPSSPTSSARSTPRRSSAWTRRSREHPCSAGASLGSEEALHFGLIPRMHRGLFAMNELPDLDDLVQVGLFNILEERDVQIRGYPVSFEIDVMVLFSANPQTYNRSGKVIPQLKDRIGATIQTHYPASARPRIEITEQEATSRTARPGRPRIPRPTPCSSRCS
jgi:magnesium chelatase subunit I